MYHNNFEIEIWDGNSISIIKIFQNLGKKISKILRKKFLLQKKFSKFVGMEIFNFKNRKLKKIKNFETIFLSQIGIF